MTLALGALTTFTFYQLTQKCISAITAFACASALILTIGTLGCVVWFILRLASRPDGIQRLFTHGSPYVRQWGTLYDALDHKRLSFIIPILGIIVLRSAVVGFGQHSGMAQAIIIALFESIACVGEHLVLRCIYLFCL
jgi:hypothetical protein